jgi:XcyI restriction endonuclease
MPRHAIKTPSASRQVSSHQLLAGARRTVLIDALSEALGRIDPAKLKAQLVEYVPADAQQILAGAGVRDEHVFPTPLVLEEAPTLVGYYRLLLGVPQKTFYGTGGMGLFKSMEVKGALSNRQRAALGSFCEAMGVALADMVRQLSPTVTQRDIRELPLLTLGSQFQGGKNNTIGKQATVNVFLAVTEAVEEYVTKREENKLTLKTPAGRVFIIKLASDPDVTIEEGASGTTRKLVALEIKGGTDRSNAHNRAGEAEKSHLKARNEGFAAFWTIIHKGGLDMTVLRKESPTTDLWLDFAQVTGRQGEDWDELRDRIADSLEIH